MRILIATVLVTICAPSLPCEKMAGAWSLEPGKYVEVVTMSSVDRLLGKTYRFDCRMKDGLWIHSGKEDHLLIEEHWKRLN